jgi:hypothetical protein
MQMNTPTKIDMLDQMWNSYFTLRNEGCLSDLDTTEFVTAASKSFRLLGTVPPNERN